ncbi:hypothetical protein F5146DRAFT_1143167 [Armillaria mellea]|nr:hypothetical protein F5146DRAFT_1143167 [Armillaria mellea]
MSGFDVADSAAISGKGSASRPALVEKMHVLNLKPKLELKLREFIGRVKRRGQPCPVSLLTLPNELLQEAAYFLCKRDQKSLRAVCRQADAVLRTTVLSAIMLKITLPFGPFNREMLEYLGSEPAGYVHKLRVRICPEPKPYYVYNGGVGSASTPTCKPQPKRLRLETKANTRAFRPASLSPPFIFNYSIPDGSDDTPPFFFQDTFECLMKLPTIHLHLTHPKFTIPYFSHLSHFRNINKLSLTCRDNSSTHMMEETLARVLSNNPGLTDLVLYLLDQPGRTMTGIDMCGIERILPKRSTTNLPLRHLALKECSIVAAPHIFRHLRGLQSLQISNFELYDTSPGFWMELSRQKILIPSIILKSFSMPSAVIDYLLSNQGMSELSLELEEETEKGDVLKRVLSEVVPRHCRTLQVLHLSSTWGSHWAIGHFPGYVAGVSQCSNLRVLCIVVEGSKQFMEPLLNLLKSLPRLQRLRLVAVGNDFYTVIERIESMRDNEPLLMALHIIVSISHRGNVRFAAGVSEWDVDDVEPDVLLDSPWEYGP